MNFLDLIDKKNKLQPFHTQLQTSLENAIESGEMPVGMQLPSEREMALRLDVSRTTVSTAYRELESRGLLRSFVGRGTFVCALPDSDEAPFAWRGKVSSRTALLNNDNISLRHLMSDNPNFDLISFAVGAPAFECFPIDAYQRSTMKILKHYSNTALGIAPTEGQWQLRKAVAKRFGTKPERILILSGSQQGIDLIARCLLDPGDTVIIDRPGYVGAIQTFRAAGASLIGWDVADADLDKLENLLVRHRPKLIYIDPTFQNPTARVLTRAERQDLLKLAARYHVPIIEDDPWRETYLDVKPPPPLYELDVQNIVIHLGTFSKILAPGLRIGWLAASEYIVDQLASIKQHENLFTEGVGQLIIADFLQRGILDEHLLNLRREHAVRRNLMKKALDRHISPRLLKHNDPQGGIHFWCRLNQGIEAQQLLLKALSMGVSFAPGAMFYPDAAAGKHELRLCFSCVRADKIEEGVKRLKNAFAAEEANPSKNHNSAIQ